MSVGSQQFEDDMAHLTKPSAKIFLEVVLNSAENLFNSAMVDLTEPGEIKNIADDHDGDQIKLPEDRLQKL